MAQKVKNNFVVMIKFCNFQILICLVPRVVNEMIKYLNDTGFNDNSDNNDVFAFSFVYYVFIALGEEGLFR